MKQSIECGFYHVGERTVVHYAAYECAAWWQDIQVEPGDYPVIADVRDGQLAAMHVELPGTIVEDYFQALYCGSALGKPYDMKQNAGKPGRYLIHSRGYEVFAEMRKEGNECPWNINIALFPNLQPCADCGGYTETRNAPITRCPGCSVAATDIRVKAVNKRFPTLLAAVREGGYAVDRFYAIFGKSIDSYFEDRRNPASASDYHAKQVATVVARVRQLRHLNRLAKCEHGHTAADACARCNRSAFAWSAAR